MMRRITGFSMPSTGTDVSPIRRTIGPTVTTGQEGDWGRLY